MISRTQIKMNSCMDDPKMNCSCQALVCDSSLLLSPSLRQTEFMFIPDGSTSFLITVKLSARALMGKQTLRIFLFTPSSCFVRILLKSLVRYNFSILFSSNDGFTLMQSHEMRFHQLYSLLISTNCFHFHWTFRICVSLSSSYVW